MADIGTEPVPKRLNTALGSFLRESSLPAARFWLLVVLVGLLSGASAAGLIKVLRFIQRIAWSGREEAFLTAVSSATPLWRWLLPTLAGALVTLVTLLVGQPLRGHGTASIIESIWARSGKLPLPRALFRGTMSIVAVALGAPLGREGALLQTGAAAGSAFARWFRCTSDQARLLVACGAAAGMAAAYNVPIGGAIFGLEVLLGSLALELFGPIVVSCVAATLLARLLTADQPTYAIPHYAISRPSELLLTAGLGVVIGVASALYSKTIHRMEHLLDRVPKRLRPFLPTVALSLVGVLAIWFPQLLGNGYDTVNAALLGVLPLWLLLVLPFAKLGATALAAASGVPGGLFTPSLFYGALLGGAYGFLANWISPGTAPPGAYALLGMGGVLAGTTHASVSAVLIIFELTNDYALMLPLMLAAVCSAAISRRVEPESIYTAVLKSRQVQVPERVAPGWLTATGAGALVKPITRTVEPSTPFQQVIIDLLEQPAGRDIYVTDERGRLLGTIVLESLKGHLPDHSLLEMTVAADVMETLVAPVAVDCSLSELAARFSQTALETLPVVDARRVLVGTISKVDLLKQARF